MSQAAPPTLPTAAVNATTVLAAASVQLQQPATLAPSSALWALFTLMASVMLQPADRFAHFTPNHVDAIFFARAVPLLCLVDMADALVTLPLLTLIGHGRALHALRAIAATRGTALRRTLTDPPVKRPTSPPAWIAHLPRHLVVGLATLQLVKLLATSGAAVDPLRWTAAVYAASYVWKGLLNHAHASTDWKKNLNALMGPVESGGAAADDATPLLLVWFCAPAARLVLGAAELAVSTLLRVRALRSRVEPVTMISCAPLVLSVVSSGLLLVEAGSALLGADADGSRARVRVRRALGAVWLVAAAGFFAVEYEAAGTVVPAWARWLG